jgi:iron transport multicopper oxidase
MRPLVLLSSLLPVFAGVNEIWWNLTYVQDANPDGLYPRRVIGVNGSWPSVPPSSSFIPFAHSQLVRLL